LRRAAPVHAGYPEPEGLSVLLLPSAAVRLLRLGLGNSGFDPHETCGSRGSSARQDKIFAELEAPMKPGCIGVHGTRAK
jgi:hypothetical protein